MDFLCVQFQFTTKQSEFVKKKVVKKNYLWGTNMINVNPVEINSLKVEKVY